MAKMERLPWTNSSKESRQSFPGATWKSNTIFSGLRQRRASSNQPHERLGLLKARDGPSRLLRLSGWEQWVGSERQIAFGLNQPFTKNAPSLLGSQGWLKWAGLNCASCQWLIGFHLSCKLGDQAEAHG